MLTDMLTLGLEHQQLLAAARGELGRAARDYHPRDTVAALLGPLGPELGLVDAMRYLDLKLTLAGDILVKVDRASMAVALEARPVYLHRQLLDLSERIPAAQLATQQSGKAALKRAFEPWLPHDLIYRRKQGFHLPLGPWFGSVLSTLAGANDGALDAWIDPAFPRALLEEHRAGQADHTQVLHNFALLQRWMKVWKPAA
jgi:asparagine synthase (glutamine-hydrolysing)